MHSRPHESTPDELGPRRDAARRARDEMRGRIASRLFDAETPRRQIGRFRVDDFIGAGGMGSVYLAHDPALGRNVAIKVLHGGLAEAGSEGEHERLVREAHALARLSDPNVVQVYEVGAHQGRVFLAMEHVEGTSLRDWQLNGQRSWREVVTMYCQAAAGLVAAHEAGIIHRDFKPSNVLVGRDGRARVADFGLARSADSTEPLPLGESSPAPDESPLVQSLTRSGAILGTPAYMAPELFTDGEVGEAADQWSFCVALWEALYGVRPYEADAVRSGALVEQRPGHRRGPRTLRVALARGLEHEPSKRWPHVRSLLQRLERIAAPPRYGKFVATAGLAAVIAGVAYADSDADLCPAAIAQIEPIWSDAVHDELGSSLDSLAQAVSRRAMGVVLDDLDRFRLEWIDAQIDSCRLGLRKDTASTTQAARVGECLDLSLVRLSKAVELLRAADLAMLASADAILDALGDPRACLEVDLAAPTDDRELASTLEAGRVELASGLPASEALSTLLAPESEIWADPSPRVAAAAFELRGRSRVEQGETDQGVRDLLEAVRRAEANRLDRAAAMLWLELVEVAANHLISTDDAEAWLDRAEAAVIRVGSPRDLSLRYLRAAALVARELGQWREAGAYIRQALEVSPLPVTLGGKLELELADVEVNTGSLEAGVARMERVLARFLDELGPSHPYVADARIYLGRLARSRGELEAALAHFEDATRIREQAYGTDSPRVSTPLMGLAAVHAATGRLDEASDEAGRVVELQRRLPAHHVERGGGLSLVGGIAQATSDHETAAAAFTELAEEWKSGPRSSERPKALTNAAWNLMMAENAAEARPLYAALRAETPPEDEFHTIGLAGLGRVDHLIGEHEIALVELEAALGIAQKRDAQPEANKELLPEIQWHLAEVLDRLGRQELRRCELAATAMSRYAQWPEREKARSALEKIHQECATEGKPR